MCCNAVTEKCDGNATWEDAPITGQAGAHVTVYYVACGTRHLAGLRYAWAARPCPSTGGCAIYGADSGLPAPPYITLVPPV